MAQSFFRTRNKHGDHKLLETQVFVLSRVANSIFMYVLWAYTATRDDPMTEGDSCLAADSCNSELLSGISAVANCSQQFSSPPKKTAQFLANLTEGLDPKLKFCELNISKFSSQCEFFVMLIITNFNMNENCYL